jgi:hypothetical protein
MSTDSRRVRAVVALVVLVLVAAPATALLVGSFHVASFQTRADATVTAAGSTVNDTRPVVGDGVLVVRASDGVPDGVRDRVGEHLRTAFAERGLDLELAESIPDDGRPAVVAVVETWGPRWNPVTPSGTVTLDLAFDAQGHERHIEAALNDEPIRFTSVEGSDLTVEATVTVRDSGTGLVSWPAYRSHLVDAAVEQTADRVVDTVRQNADPR